MTTPITPTKHWGHIHGGNLYRRAYFDGQLGIPSGEPWFIEEGGRKWSAFDVQFHPDDAVAFNRAYDLAVAQAKSPTP